MEIKPTAEAHKDKSFKKYFTRPFSQLLSLQVPTVYKYQAPITLQLSEAMSCFLWITLTQPVRQT